MTYKKAILKRRLEYIGMWPFVLLGKLYGMLFPLKTEHTAFLFFPSADIGGAIKVNADLTNCIVDKKPLIIFSKKPKNNGHRDLFDIPGVQVIDLHKMIDNKLYHFVNFFYRGVIAAWINKVENPVVFGGEGIYFYKIIPHLRKGTRCIELCHLDTWLPYSIGFIDLITCRVFSSISLKKAVEAQYRRNHLPESYFNRLFFVENKIDIPPYKQINNEKLEVVFIGRGAPQKRVPLTAAIAERMHALSAPAHFSFVGDVEAVIDVKKYPYCTFYGNVRDAALMNKIYQNSDVLILTSAYEGLPLVVMQMMAHAKIVLSTAVNAIPDYVRHMENGLLITAIDEAGIVDEGVALLQLLIKEPALKVTLGKRSREIAIEKFSGEVFCKQYRQLLFPEAS